MPSLGLSRAGLTSPGFARLVVRRIGEAAGLGLVPGYSALYLFDEGSGTTVIDRSGNGNNGTFGAGGAAPTRTSQGVSCDGGDYIGFGTGSGLNIGNADHTLIVVCSPPATPATAESLIGKTAFDVNEWGLHTSLNKFALKFRGSGASVTVSSNVTYTAGAPYMVAYTRSGTDLALYINGVKQIATGVVNSEPSTAAREFRMGRLSAGTNYFNGVFHAAAAYPFAFTPLQIAQEFAAFSAILAPRGIDFPKMTLASPASNVIPAAVLFRFDDAFSDIFTTAYPILAAAGMPATVYVNSATVGTAGHMTDAQLVALDAAGWDIANHGATHANLLTSSEAQQETEFADCADYIDALGLTRASHHVAYPGGPYDADTLAAMAATGMLTGQDIGAADTTVPIAAPHELHGVCGMSATDTLWYAKAYLATSTPGRVVTYFGHHIAPEPAASTWTTADFAALVAYIKALGCRVVTISQLWNYMQAGHTWPAEVER